MRVLILALLTVFSLYGCNNDQKTIKSTSIYLFIDLTDTAFRDLKTYLPDLPIIMDKIGVDTISGGFNGGEVKIFLIGNVSQTRHETINLKVGTSGLLGQNPIERIEDIKKFYRDLNNKVTGLLQNNTFQMNNSLIYQNVCMELNRLQSAHGDNKIAVIYSDMLENSNLFSFYGNANLGQIQSFINNNNPHLGALLNNTCSLPDLSKINIHIVFPNRTNTTDPLITLAANFWTILFSAKNGTVKFGQQLNL